MSEPIRISARPTFGPTENSPVLPPDQFALEFVLMPAIGERDEPTVALLAAACVPRSFGDVYGGRLASAVNIVAVDMQTGKLFYRNCERGHTVPLSLVMNANPTPPPANVAPLESSEFHFAVDLKNHLSLPEAPGAYAVFLWLDSMTSVVHTLDAPQMLRGSAAPVIANSKQLRRVNPSDAASLINPAPKLVRSASVLAGSVSGSSHVMTIAALDFRSRQIMWMASSVEASKLYNVDSFEFDPETMFSGPDWYDKNLQPRKLFFVVCSGTRISPVVVYEA